MDEKKLIEKAAREVLSRISKDKASPTPETYRAYFNAYMAEKGVSGYLSESTKNASAVEQTGEEKEEILRIVAQNINNQAEHIVDAVENHNEKLSESDKKLKEIISLEDTLAQGQRTVSEIAEIQSANRLLMNHINKAKKIVNYESEIIEKLKNAALKDYLTNAGNRQLFDISLQKELNRQHRYGRNAAILMFDLDNFKQINDTYGHVVGDRVIQSVVHYIRENIRSTDTVYRYGGDEFIVLLPETDANQAATVGKKILDSINKINYKYKEHLFNVTSSCGITEIKKRDDIETVLERVDNALYNAKRSKKGEFYCII